MKLQLTKTWEIEIKNESVQNYINFMSEQGFTVQLLEEAK